PTADARFREVTSAHDGISESISLPCLSYVPFRARHGATWPPHGARRSVERQGDRAGHLGARKHARTVEAIGIAWTLQEWPLRLGLFLVDADVADRAQMERSCSRQWQRSPIHSRAAGTRHGDCPPTCGD